MVRENIFSDRKAQMKIQQMSFMLIAVVILFVMVGMFFLVIKASNLEREATAIEAKNAILLASKISNSPEFSCGQAFDFGNQKVDCVDWDKVMILKENIDKYDSFWGVSNVVVRRLYPEEGGEVECGIDNYPDCGFVRLRSGEVGGAGDASNFVALCRKTRESGSGKTYDKCELGKIFVSFEAKSVE